MRGKRVRRHHFPLRCFSIVCFLMATLALTSFTSGVSEEVDSPMVTRSAAASLYLEPIEYEQAIMLRHVEPIQAETPEPEEKPWTEDEVIVLTKMVFGEAGGVPSKMERAACVWCVLNRCDTYGQGVIEVTTAPYQFVGYRAENPVMDELYDLCEDVLARWYAEKDGETDVGRVLPPDYLYFHGDGKHNYFRNEFRGGTTWDWSYPNPYET